MSEKIKFWIGNGSTVTVFNQTNYREFYIENDIVFINWFGKKYRVTDTDIVIEIEDIILSNRNRLISFSRKQSSIDSGYDERKLIRGTFKDECSGEIDDEKFSICNRFTKKDLNTFYEKIRKELFDIVGKSIIQKRAVEIVLCPLCHMDLKKYYYGKPIEGMDKTKYIISDFEKGENSPTYFCESCNKNFDDNMNEVIEIK